jgi:hypothetical protein
MGAPQSDSRNVNPFGLRKYQTSVYSDSLKKSASSILSPNEKIIEMKPWLARGQINKTDIGEELYKKANTRAESGNATRNKINVE